MKIFKLPDLGEGLPDAVIRQWYIQEGQEIEKDQPMVAMETAKALVDVPAPFSGKVMKLFGKAGDTVDTGQPLIGFEGSGDESDLRKDTGTVVGNIQEDDDSISEKSQSQVSVQKSNSEIVKATPAARRLAHELGIALQDVVPSGEIITPQDVKKMTQSLDTANGRWENLSSVRRAMVMSMHKAHQEVVPVSLMEEADLYRWYGKEDITVRTIRAIEIACKEVPILNATFEATQLKYHLNNTINVAIAVDTPHGLYVPVLKDVAQKNDGELREAIEHFKKQATQQTLAPSDLRDGTILLSNFGSIAGKYATPLLIPPMVAIIGIGRVKQTPVAWEEKIVIHPILPLSITADHRLITGGEISRFLKALITSLQK